MNPEKPFEWSSVMKLGSTQAFSTVRKCPSENDQLELFFLIQLEMNVAGCYIMVTMSRQEWCFRLINIATTKSCNYSIKRTLLMISENMDCRFGIIKKRTVLMNVMSATWNLIP